MFDKMYKCLNLQIKLHKTFIIEEKNVKKF
jgi:hypothetical protein